jgi:hypothetical protein
LTLLPALYIKDVLPFPLLVPKLPAWYLNWLKQQFSTNRSSEELHDLFLRADDLTVIRRIVRETDAVTASLINTLPADLSPREYVVLDIADLSHIASPGVIATLSDRPIPRAAQGFIDEILVEIKSLNARSEKEISVGP